MIEHVYASGCYLNQSDNQFKNFYRLKELDEIESKLRGMIGRKIAFLRCVEFHFRAL
jgi:hypothetical protein